MHVAGKRDRVAAYERQVPITDAVREVDGCENTGKPWARDCLRYPSPKGTPVVTYIFDGAHVVPADAPALIVRFFRECGGESPAKVPDDSK